MARAQSTFRPADLTRALKATLAAGVTVARIELAADKIVLTVGEVSTSPSSSHDDLDRELAEFEAKHGQG